MIDDKDWGIYQKFKIQIEKGLSEGRKFDFHWILSKIDSITSGWDWKYNSNNNYFYHDLKQDSDNRGIAIQHSKILQG